jgi:NOL1/NOP2/fmu family ribosome biogenesis protein
VKEFLGRLKIDIPEERLEIREDRLYLLPEGIPDLKGLRVMRSGLLLGEIKKNCFEPSQALACALRKEEYDAVYDMDIEDEDVIRYLKCETIEAKIEVADGFVLVCAGGFPLGWAKSQRGTLKNKYLPGWRMM